jgi:hypothetical protein
MQGKSSVLPGSKPLNKEAILPFLGTYKAMAPRNQIKSLIDDLVSTTDVFIKNDTLNYQAFFGERKQLMPVLGNQFRNKDCLIPTSIFMEDGNTKVFFLDRGYMGKINPVPLWILRVAIGLSLLLGVLLIPFNIAWLIMLLLKKLKQKEFMVGIFPLLAFISFGVLVFVFIDFTSSLSNMITGGSVNFHTLTIFISSLLLPAFSIISMYSIIRSFKTIRGRFIKYFLLLSSLGFCFLSLYLLHYGWIGLRIWSY